jgi:acyl-CoA thioester hydrolase
MDTPARAPHVERLQVRWGDMDIMGHLNNAVYFTFCESGRMGYFQAVHMPDHFAGGRFGPALAAANLNFRRQVRWPAEVDVLTRVVRLGRSSFEMEYTLQLAAGAERVADGRGVIVWVDYRTGRPQPLPDALVAAIRDFEGHPAALAAPPPTAATPPAGAAS